MAVKSRIKMNKRQWNNVIGGFEVLAKNITDRIARSSEKQADELLAMMWSRVADFEHTGELRESIVRDPIQKDGNKSNIMIRVTAPHAMANEFGVTPHLISVDSVDDPSRLVNWMQKKMPGGVTHGIMVGGGPNTRLQKGNSDNQFFRISIETYVRGNKSRSQYIQALRQALRESFKGGK